MTRALRGEVRSPLDAEADDDDVRGVGHRATSRDVGEIRDGMTIGIGGWGSRRKPMALVRALLRSDVRDLTVVSYGGPDVGLLCRAGKVSRVVYAFVSLDSIPLEPHFRKARESGAVAATELDEGMFLLGLQAAAWRVPYLPTRVGLGSDIETANPWLQRVQSPYRSPSRVRLGTAGCMCSRCSSTALDCDARRRCWLIVTLTVSAA